jgi:TolB-like protein
LTTEPGAGGHRAVFLSYASEDAVVAGRICDALRVAGIEVWFDRSELRGGDAWDSKIRRQIKSCALFVPVISNNANSRAEGYFRLEWKLAVDRSHLIAPDQVFLCPIAIDEVNDSDDRVPERFREVQWLNLPVGDVPPAVVARIAQLVASAAPARAALAALPQPARSSRPEPLAVSPRRRPRGWGLWAAALLVVIIAGAWGARHMLSRTSAVVPYSLEDRRMTFAVLPFQAPQGDDHAREVARVAGEMVTAELEARAVFAHVAPRRSVADAEAKLASPRALAKSLDVHFLVRGNVTKAPAGYTINLALVDGDSERITNGDSLVVAADATQPRWRDDVRIAAWHLIATGVDNEVRRAADKPFEALDVRDLSFRALASWRGHWGPSGKPGYALASELLNRALALAPNDPLATYITAWMNLCDCMMAVSTNIEEQKSIGAAALDRYLAIDPYDLEMLEDKAGLFQLRGRWSESLVILETLLKRTPDRYSALALKAGALIHLGRAREAVPIGDVLAERFPDRAPELTALAANAHYAVGDVAGAAELAQNAIPRMSEYALRSPISGAVYLTQIAAEARLGHRDRAESAFADFTSLIPVGSNLSGIRKWMHPTADLAGFEPLFEGLRLAGIPD